MSDIQLEFNLQSSSNVAVGNRFKEAINNGEFVVLIETATPERENALNVSAERLSLLENAVLNSTYAHASLAITDNYLNSKSWRTPEYASTLSNENRDRHLIYLSGRDTTNDEMNDLLSLAKNINIQNIVPVSGNAFYGEKAKICRKHFFNESTNVLELIREKYSNSFFCGSTINPFVYTPETLLAMNAKLFAKLDAGASFIVTQTGWDMLKLQSLNWYMSNHKLFYPTIARLFLLTPEKVEDIINNKYPGINIPSAFEKILCREFEYFSAQFEATQYRKLELQAAGCHFLGYSGIQLNGASNPQKAKFAIDRIQKALKEFSSFEHWLDEYNSFLARTEMAPFSRSFYLYDRNLHRQYPIDKEPIPNEIPIPRIGKISKLKYYLSSWSLRKTDRCRPQNREILKRLLVNCKMCNKCILPEKSFVCVESCPKHLRTGVCGNVKPNGMCEVENKLCVHVKVAKISHWRDCVTIKPFKIKKTFVSLKD